MESGVESTHPFGQRILVHWKASYLILRIEMK
jgi:hypothetical protein